MFFKTLFIIKLFAQINVFEYIKIDRRFKQLQSIIIIAEVSTLSDV